MDQRNRRKRRKLPKTWNDTLQWFKSADPYISTDQLITRSTAYSIDRQVERPLQRFESEIIECDMPDAMAQSAVDYAKFTIGRPSDLRHDAYIGLVSNLI